MVRVCARECVDASVCVRLRGGYRPVLSVRVGVYVLMRVCVGG